MKRSLFPITMLSLLIVFFLASAGFSTNTATVSKSAYRVGDVVTIEGTIDPEKDLFIAVSSQKAFAPKDTDGVHETKRLKKEAEKRGFTQDTSIPALYYMLTTNPEKFGTVADKRFGGPSFMPGIYKTTMFKLAKFDKLDEEAKSVLGPVGNKDSWNFFWFAHHSCWDFL